jgi:hypothetical protein
VADGAPLGDSTHGTVLCGLAGEGRALLDTPALGSVVTLVRPTEGVM